MILEIGHLKEKKFKKKKNLYEYAGKSPKQTVFFNISGPNNKLQLKFVDVELFLNITTIFFFFLKS